MKNAQLPEPVFQKEGIFTVSLKRPTQFLVHTTQKTDSKIIEILALNPKASRAEIAKSP